MLGLYLGDHIADVLADHGEVAPHGGGGALDVSGGKFDEESASKKVEKAAKAGEERRLGNNLVCVYPVHGRGKASRWDDFSPIKILLKLNKFSTVTELTPLTAARFRGVSKK